MTNLLGVFVPVAFACCLYVFGLLNREKERQAYGQTGEQEAAQKIVSEGVETGAEFGAFAVCHSASMVFFSAIKASTSLLRSCSVALFSW